MQQPTTKTDTTKPHIPHTDNKDIRGWVASAYPRSRILAVGHGGVDIAVAAWGRLPLLSKTVGHPYPACKGKPSRGGYPYKVSAEGAQRVVAETPRQ